MVIWGSYGIFNFFFLCFCNFLKNFSVFVKDCVAVLEECFRGFIFFFPFQDFSVFFRVFLVFLTILGCFTVWGFFLFVFLFCFVCVFVFQCIIGFLSCFFVFVFVFSVFEFFFLLYLRFYFWSLRVLGVPGSCSPCL